MRLKRLELKGFKSFATETTIHFNEDVIGIVGPNGSGKSNVVDAIRWVLGEQKSKELRLDQMTSVIFNGTKKRKQSGMAQVSITFDNTKNLLPTEYQSITITRTLYRTGESEYRLNGTLCRLRDITTLFLDTGIGSNSYAIIALGMVDDILNDKENSRLKMFEQAAGVSKYKIRKRETIQKLESTTEDLNRIEDLLHEIDNNLKTLEKQARRAKRYLELKAEYKELSIELAVHRAAELKEQQKTVGQKVEQEEDRYRQAEVEVRQLEAKLEAERKANLDKEKTLSERQRDLNNLVGKIRGMESDRKMQEQKLQFLEQNRAKFVESVQDAERRARQLQSDIEHYREEVTLEKRIEARLELELEQAETTLQKIRESHGTLKSDLDVVMQSQQQAERAVFELEKQKAINGNQIANYRQELERSSQGMSQRQVEAATLQEKIAQLEEEEKRFSKRLEDLEQAEALRLQALQAAETENEALTKRITTVNRELDARRNEFKLTKSMIENLEGFPESIRFLSNNKDWKKDAPLLSDLIYVNEAYRVAIENYLEPYLNYYVVQSMEDAYEAVQLLSRSQKGKANFFVLDAFRDYQAPILMLPETMNAIELVEMDPVYRNLCNYLLENVLVSEKEDYSGALPDNAVLLSKSGQLIRRRYSISGGSIGLFEGKKIGRKKNLEMLEAVIKKSEREADRLSTEFYTLKAKTEGLKAQQTSAQIQQERAALNKLVQEKVSLLTRMESFETYLRESNETRHRATVAIGQLEQDIADIEVRLLEKHESARQVKERISNTDGSFRQVAEQLSQASTAYNEQNIAFIRQQNKVGTLQRELSFREKQLEEANAAMVVNAKNIEQNEVEITQAHDLIQQAEQALLADYEVRKACEGLLTEAEQSYFKARGAINEIEDALRKATKVSMDTQMLVNQLKEKLTDVRFKISSVGQRLNIEFGISINDIINRQPNPEHNEADLGPRVDRLKERIDSYGEINPLAVEAYDEMKIRHETISEQRDDVVQAKASLLETIKEIEETATVQFLEAFGQARLYFIDVFRSLFTEDDNCDLILLNPETPLESKIEIVAKPKGKRPQSINQLSGGEKTLTATALLFALYLLKPAPFCIFDEVDAPLDDSNISKFNKIIKKFSKDSQFIIVTHNKLTMEAVDTIYGVYMAEQGVSGVSPVDFRHFETSGAFEVTR